MGYDKYQKLIKMVSLDGGITWEVSVPVEYSTGNLIEQYSPDCGYVPPTRWILVPDEYICDGFDKYTKEKKQESPDNGTNWVDVVPEEIRKATLIESISEDCGYVAIGNSFVFTKYGEKLQNFCINGTLLELAGTRYTYSSPPTTFSGFASTTTAVNLKTIKFSDEIDTSNVKSFYQMFKGCSSLTEIICPISTESATNFGGMFQGCSVVNLDLSTFTGENVQSVANMFNGCSELEYLDVSNLILKDNITYSNKNNMFSGCTSLNRIKCKQAFKDWCIKNQSTIALPNAMREGGDGIWEIVDADIIEYRWITDPNEYICDDTTKYEKQIKQVSYDEGETWVDVVPEETQQGEIIETDSTDCGYVPPTTNDKIKLELNNGWILNENINPDTTQYYGVYIAKNGWALNKSQIIMTVNTNGVKNLTLYIRSVAPNYSNYYYMMVSQLDKSLSGASYSNTELVKAHTRGTSNKNTSISDYQKVEFNNIPEGNHTITIMFITTTSTSSTNYDGYVLFDTPTEVID